MTNWGEKIDTHRSESRNSILDTAEALIGDHGLSGLTMSALADRSGISRQTLYKYFADVDDVAVGIVKREALLHHDHLSSALDSMDSAKEKLNALIQHANHSESHNSHVFHESYFDSTAVRAVLDDHMVAAIDIVASVLTEGIDEGFVRTDVDTQSLARLIAGILSGAAAKNVHDSNTAEPPLDLQDVIERIITP